MIQTMQMLSDNELRTVGLSDNINLKGHIS